MNDVLYNETIEKWIISNLDGWEIESEDDVESEDDDNSIDPFMTTDEVNDRANKTISRDECKLAYEETLDMAYIHTNRMNVDDLSEIELRMFLRAVCKWTASNLWNKYNIQVNNDDMEGTYVRSYGGLLYTSAMKSLQSFVNQRITGFTDYTDDSDNDDDIWIV